MVSIIINFFCALFKPPIAYRDLSAVFSLAEINMDVPDPSIPWYSSPTFLRRDEEQNKQHRRDSQQATYYEQNGAPNSAIDGR